MGQRFVLPAAGGGGARSGTGGPDPGPGAVPVPRGSATAGPPNPFFSPAPPRCARLGGGSTAGGGGGSLSFADTGAVRCGCGGGAPGLQPPVCSRSAGGSFETRRGRARPWGRAEVGNLPAAPGPGVGWGPVAGGPGWGLFSELPPRPLFPKSSQAGASRLPERDGKGAAFGFVEDFGSWGVAAVTEDGGARNNAVLEFTFPFVFASCPRGSGGLRDPPLSKLFAGLWESLAFVHGERAGSAAWRPTTRAIPS